MATEFERAIGWTGPNLKSLIGRDITVFYDTRDKRASIRDYHVTIEDETNTIGVSFLTEWVAERRGDGWVLYTEADEDEPLIPIHHIDPRYNSSRTDLFSGTVALERACIHKEGDCIDRPEQRSMRSTDYFPQD